MRKKKVKKKIKKKVKKTVKKTVKKNNNIKLIITIPHWFCLTNEDNICDQSSYINAILLYETLRNILKHKVVLLKPSNVHRSITDANRNIQQNKYGIYHIRLKKFLNDILRNLNKKSKILLDIHSYHVNNNLPFYLLYLNLGYQKYYAEHFALKICKKMNINYSPEMVKEGTLDNEIIRLALKQKGIKFALIIEFYDNNDNFTQNLLIESIKDVVLEYL